MAYYSTENTLNLYMIGPIALHHTENYKVQCVIKPKLACNNEIVQFKAGQNKPSPFSNGFIN